MLRGSIILCSLENWVWNLDVHFFRNYFFPKIIVDVPPIQSVAKPLTVQLVYPRRSNFESSQIIEIKPVVQLPSRCWLVGGQFKTPPCQAPTGRVWRTWPASTWQFQGLTFAWLPLCTNSGAASTPWSHASLVSGHDLAERATVNNCLRLVYWSALRRLVRATTKNRSIEIRVFRPVWHYRVSGSFAG